MISPAVPSLPYPVSGGETPDRLTARAGGCGAHVQSDHFKKAQQTLPPYLAHTPRIVNFTIPQDDWSLLGEMAVPED